MTMAICDPNREKETKEFCLGKPLKRKPLFYLEGRTIHKRPVSIPLTDGSTSIGVGFPVCTVSKYANAEEVLSLFNEHGE